MNEVGTIVGRICGGCLLDLHDFRRLVCMFPSMQGRGTVRSSRVQSPLAHFKRCLSYPLAIKSTMTGKSCALVHVLCRQVFSFLGNPPSLRMLAFEDSAFTYNWSVKVVDEDGGSIKSRLLEGHQDSVLAVSVDGDLIVTGSYDETAKVWNARRGVLLQTLESEGAVTAVACQGNIIVTGTCHGTMQVWVAQGTGALSEDSSIQALHGCFELLATTRGHSGTLYTVAIGCQKIATGGRDSVAQIWDARPPPFLGQHVHVLRGHSRRVYAVALHQNLNLVVTGSADGTSKLWNTFSGQLLQTFSRPVPTADPKNNNPSSILWWRARLRPLDPIVSVAVSGEYILTGSADGEVCLRNRQSGEFKHLSRWNESGPLGSVKAVAIRSDGIAIACFKRGFAKVWHVESGVPQFVLTSGFAAFGEGVPSYALALQGRT